MEAIQELAIRGAPALGVAGAMGVALAAALGPDDPEALRREVESAADALAVARPTAVNLAWGVGEARAVLDGPWTDAADGSERGWPTSPAASTTTRSSAAGGWARTGRRCSATRRGS